jgi:hypothetical protein
VIFGSFLVLLECTTSVFSASGLRSAFWIFGRRSVFGPPVVFSILPLERAGHRSVPTREAKPWIQFPLHQVAVRADMFSRSFRVSRSRQLVRVARVVLPRPTSCPREGRCRSAPLGRSCSSCATGLLQRIFLPARLGRHRFLLLVNPRSWICSARAQRAQGVA